MEKMFFKCLLISAIFLVLASSNAIACTSFFVSGKDGSVVVGRSMEFAADVNSKLTYIPGGTKYVGTLPDGKPGLSWVSKYASLYLDVFGVDCVCDGMNEAGLSVAGLFFPGYAGYQKIRKGEEKHALSSFDLTAWMLQNFSSVEEVRKAISSVTVWGFEIAELGGVVPVHYAVYDSTGKGLVIEYVAGELNVYDNPVGVMTNSPDFPWHMANLKNYVNLSPLGCTDISLKGVKFDRLGQGSGLIGIPGDPTPPSRFIKAAFMSSWGKGAENSDDAVLLAFHILNSLDIPYGVAGSEIDGKISYDFTSWVTARDLTNLRFFYRTYENQSIRMVDLKKLSRESEKKVFHIKDDKVTLWTDITSR